ncbi:MAG: ribosome maturation factor RimM [Actinomycetota bacterium]|nr:ribosome maturation factor RimM [Actinomycetota bacterium]
MTSRLNSSTEPGDFPADPIPVGYVRRAHGIRGAVVINPSTDDPDRFVVGRVFETDNKKHPCLTVLSVQSHPDGLLTSFEGVVDRNTAEALRGTSLLIAPAERRNLEADEFWPDQLVGLGVVDSAGTDLGTVIGVVEGAAQDRLLVEAPNGTFEVPFVAAIVTAVDISGGRLVVDPPEGLTPAGQPE